MDLFLLIIGLDVIDKGFDRLSERAGMESVLILQEQFGRNELSGVMRDRSRLEQHSICLPA